MAKKETNEKPKEQKKPAVKKSTAKKTAPKKAADKKKSTIKRAVKKETYVPNLKKQYKESIVPALKKRFGYRNVMEVPHISVISINMGIGDAKTNPKALENAVEELSLITGQKAVVTRSRDRKSVV